MVVGWMSKKKNEEKEERKRTTNEKRESIREERVNRWANSFSIRLVVIHVGFVIPTTHILGRAELFYRTVEFGERAYEHTRSN